MTTPYITNALLRQASSGIDWDTLVYPDAATTQTDAEITNICWRATALIDNHCNQPLRATIDTEFVNAPGDRAWTQPNGMTRIFLSRWPILSIASVQVTVTRFPSQWQTLTAGTQYELRQPGTLAMSSAAAGTSSIELGSGIVSWFNGREGTQVQVQYINGWPHGGLTADVAQGATTLAVDDTTGFAGQPFTVYDGAETETATCSTCSTTSGPGVLTLASPMAYGHEPGVLASALPASVQEAAILLAVDIAMLRGATALALPSAEHMAATGGAAGEDMRLEAYALIAPFRRIF